MPNQGMQLCASEDRVEAYSRIRRAVFHLTECWDHLHEAQWLLLEPLDIVHISDLAASIHDGGEAFMMPDEVINDLLKKVKDGTYEPAQ